MTALIIITATTVQVLFMPSMAQCVLSAQYFLPFARVWCVSAALRLRASAFHRLPALAVL